MKRKIFFLLALICAGFATAEIPTGYYNSAEGLSGSSLYSALTKCIASFKVVGYDNLWAAYKTTDTDDNGYLLDIYSTCSFNTAITGAKGGSCQGYNYGGVCDCYNREHSVPQDWFGSGNPKSDLFNVYPTDGKVNGQRSNYPYGECSGGTSLGGKALGKLGNSTFSGYASSNKVFEPADQYKGDLARSYFYMATCYASTCKNWGSTKPAAFGSAYNGLSDYGVALLLKWHRQDPVSDKEKKRNEAVYGKQKNRNPFIDYPELAEHIWGNKKTTAWYSGTLAVEQTAIQNLQLYPNPAGDFITISGEMQDFDYTICTISGQVVEHGQSTSGASISLADFANGLYLIRIESEGRSQVEKLIVNK